MKVNYDDTVDALYIELSGAVVSRSVEYDPGTHVDVDASGTIVGIEVIQPARSWPLQVISVDFELDSATVSMLDALWGSSTVYPYAPLLIAS